MSHIGSSITGTPPKITADGLPEAERGYVFHINNGLTDLHWYVRDFEAALLLFNHCQAEQNIISAKGLPVREEDEETSSILTGWKFVAARDAAMTINHFAKAMNGVKATLHTCPMLDSLVNRRQLRRSADLFRRHFPRAEALRHAVAHTAEIMGTPQSVEQHWSTDPVPGFTYRRGREPEFNIRNGLSGRIFSTTFEKRVLSYKLARVTLEQLDEVKQTFFAAFWRAKVTTAALAADPSRLERATRAAPRPANRRSRR